MLKEQTITCKNCLSNEPELVYSGPIRGGGINSAYIDGYSIYRCKNCKLVFLYPVPDNLENFYESDQYRKQFFGSAEAANIQKQQDHEQNERLNKIGVENIRNKIVADFGAGPGLFLDVIRGIAKKTYAIEPTKVYHNHLISNGHLCFNYGSELLKNKIKVDVAVSFDTIEHILDTRKYLQEIYDSLTNEGTFYLSMPNLTEIIKLAFPTEYEPFNFQIAHLYYFEKGVIESILDKIGFKQIDVGYLHKYDISNLLQWAYKKGPGKFNTVGIFDKYFMKLYKHEIERLGISSHFFIVAKK